MANIVQMYRLPSSTASTYVGPIGQLVVDTGTNAIRVQDGVTPGGILTLVASANLSDLTDKVAARAALQLLSAALHDATDFDVAGAAAAALSTAEAFATAADLVALASAEAYTDTAKAAAIATAATDATTKANAAVATSEGYTDTKLALAPLKANNGSDFANAALTYSNLGGRSMGIRNVFIQSGGSPSGGSDGDIFLIY